MVVAYQCRALTKQFMVRSVLVTALSALLFIGMGSPCLAEDVPAASPSEQTTDVSSELKDPELTVPGFSGVDITHLYLSSSVEVIAQRIDSFFGEERIYDEATGTYVQARGSVIYGRGGEFDFDSKFRAKVDLPQLKRKANLVIESDDEKDSTEDFNRITTGKSVLDNVEDNDVSAAVQVFLKEKKRWNLSVRPGLKFKSSIETFIKLRFRRVQPLGEAWLSRGTVEVGYFSEYGWENEYEIDFERDIGDNNFFRSASNVLWREDEPGNQFLGQRFLLIHERNRLTSYAFEVGTSAETRPTLHSTSYFGSIRFRRSIHKGWLFFEVKPQVIWERENDFKADPALVLTLEMLFGAKHLD